MSDQHAADIIQQLETQLRREQEEHLILFSTYQKRIEELEEQVADLFAALVGTGEYHIGVWHSSDCGIWKAEGHDSDWCTIAGRAIHKVINAGKTVLPR